MKRILCVSFILGLLMIFPLQSWGQITPGNTQPFKFEITVGKSLTLESKSLIKRASVVNPEIADVLVTSPTQVYVTAKAPGSTSLTFWGPNENVFAVANILVTVDLSVMRELVVQLFPEEKDVKVVSVHNNIAVTGTVTSATALSQITDMLQPYSAKKVINLAEVSGIQQVMVEVKIIEISHSNLKQLGINWNYIYKGTSAFLSFGTISALTQGLNSLLNASTNTVAGAVNRTHNSFAGVIDALDEKGLLKVLASPTLTTISGKTANFLAGGEIPIPVPQVANVGAGSTITVEYKPFGVGLNFTPVVLSSKKINFQVSPEVSEPDFSNTIRLSGFVLPTFATRRASTTIELDDGQSFVMAGLLRDDSRKIISKFPLLGDAPILGALFRSTKWQRNETELVIVATPRLVKPIDMTKEPLPADNYSEPSDFEFYLNGRTQGSGAGTGRSSNR